MAKNEYVFSNTTRKPNEGITVFNRTIGENEVHLRYTPKAGCYYPTGAWQPGHCLLTDKKLYFVTASFKKELEYVEIPVSKIEKIQKTKLLWEHRMHIYVDAFEYIFDVPDRDLWIDSIVKLKEEDTTKLDAGDGIASPSSSDKEQPPRMKQFCPGCGAKVESGDLYCVECGKALK